MEVQSLSQKLLYAPPKKKKTTRRYYGPVRKAKIKTKKIKVRLKSSQNLHKLLVGV